ncbi:hypothetical protein, partial [Nocardiopsis sp. TNDT3]|uniref:hypothetical protein n=1 Tax=Nocardiopsis sp. TNDT3 TaxID=2249354 RepID=UPI001E2E54A4
MTSPCSAVLPERADRARGKPKDGPAAKDAVIEVQAGRTIAPETGNTGLERRSGPDSADSAAPLPAAGPPADP